MKEMRSVLKEILGSDLSSGETIRGARIKANLSQDVLAEITGIQRPNISALENDRIELTLKYAIILGVALNIHPSELLFPNGKIKKTEAIKKIEKRAKIIQKRHAVG